MSLWETILSGGSVMIVLGVFSVTSLALIIRLALLLARESKALREIAEEIHSTREHGDLKWLETYCEEKVNYGTRIVSKALNRAGSPYIVVKESLEEAGLRETTYIRKDTGYLNLIGILSPLLGLLGTVFGMMESFNVIAFQEGMGKPELLAAGIAKALVTTAAGLLIAIPAMGFGHYFGLRIQRLAVDAQEICSELIHYIARRI